MSILISDIPGLLKTKFSGAINDSVFKELMLLNQITINEKDVIRGSRDVKQAARLTRNNGVSFGDTSGSVTLPTPGASSVQHIVSQVKAIYGLLEFEGPTLRATLSDEGSFARIMQSEMLNLTDSMKIEMNRAAYLDGTGAVAVADTRVGTPTNTVTFWDTYADPLLNMQYFDEGQYVSFYTSGGTAHGTYKISAIDTSTGTLTFTTDPLAGGVVQNDICYIATNRNLEPMGLLGMADDGSFVSNLFSVNNTNFSRWNGVVDDGSAGGAVRAITEEMLQNMITKIQRTGKKILIITTEDIRNKIARLIKPAVVQAPTWELKGGFMTINYNGIMVYADLYAPKGHIFIVEMEYLKGHVLFPTNGTPFNAISFSDFDNQTLHGTRGNDIYWAKAVADYEMTCTRRNAFGRISDIDATL